MPTQVRGATLGQSISVGTEPYGEWTQFDNLRDSDNNYCEANFENDNTVTEIIHSSGFNFNIPVWAVIDGITVNIERKSQTLGVVYDSIVQLIVDGSRTGDNKKNTTTAWPTTDGTQGYGGAADTWGLSPTVDDINSDLFGVALQPLFEETYEQPWTQTELDVDQIEVAVTYSTNNDIRWGPDPVGKIYYKDSEVLKVYWGSSLIVEKGGG